MSDDFVVTVHALERFQERFPKDWENDDQTGLVIYNEVIDAIDNGRFSHVPPLEFANYNISQWHPTGALFTWNPERTRGYVLLDQADGMTIITVLEGTPYAEARQILYGSSVSRRKEGNGDPKDKPPQGEAGVGTPS